MTTLNAGNQVVVFGKTPDVKKLSKGRGILWNSTTIYKASLPKLAPSTRYYYRCGSEETGWSDLFSFMTPPRKGSDKPFTVGVFGDTQNNEFNEEFQKTTEIAKRLSALQPGLSLHMGDMVNNGAVDGDWLKLLDAIQPLGASSPVMPTLGNHDVENQEGDGFQKPYFSFKSLFALPGNGTDYAFDYGNAHFVSIFSGVAPQAAKNGRLRYGPDSPERKWLEEDLMKARKNPAITWIVVFTHYPVYSFGWSNVSQWKETLAPILDKYQRRSMPFRAPACF